MLLSRASLLLGFKNFVSLVIEIRVCKTVQKLGLFSSNRVI